MAKKASENEKQIVLRGVRVNNLKNVDVSFPSGKLIVVTGLSGSGKSSLVFDTLYAEGQRRYVESLSAYARQFLGRMSKPEVDFIDGISPAIAIEQKSLNANPRSTVGTVTEIYEYLKLLYARVGRIYSPVSGREVKRHSVSNVADFAAGLSEGTRLYILAPIVLDGKTWDEYLDLKVKSGFSRLYRVNREDASGSEVLNIDDLHGVRTSWSAKDGGETPARKKRGSGPGGPHAMRESGLVGPHAGDGTSKGESRDLYLLVDRLVIHDHQGEGSELYARLFDSIQTAFHEGDGRCFLEITPPAPHMSRSRFLEFSNKLEADGMTFVKPSPNFFSYNNPYGACKTCEGMGTVVGVSEDLVIPDPTLSVYENCVAVWRGEKMSEWKQEFIQYAEREKFPIHRPYKDLTPAEKRILWEGGKYAPGINDTFKFIEKNSYKIQYRVMASRYRGKTLCPDCHGSRLRADAEYVKVGGKSISELTAMQVDALSDFFADLHLNAHDRVIARRMLIEIGHRLDYLKNVGLSYLSLNRVAGSLSGGESQRIYLANSLGSALVGSLYILDEPSIGLHSRDSDHLIQVLKALRDLGNTVIVVEHDESIMLSADYIIDVGPKAGREGGEIVFAGTPAELLKRGNTLTAQYLRGELKIEVPPSRRSFTRSIRLTGARLNNLKGVEVEIPLNVMTVVTGVSGSGKTSLIRQTLYAALQRALGTYQGGDAPLKYKALEGDYKLIEAVELVDQNPIGKSSRSNPATYVKAFDDIRDIFASQPLAKKRLYTPGYFSFNMEGGRCEACQGEGVIKVEMQFMADLYLPCEECHGKRFKSEVLEVKYRDKDIAEVLEMTVDEALDFFSADPEGGAAVKRLCAKLQVLQQVGLGYLHLGQSSNSLSGGEAQRVKLAYFLIRGRAEERGHVLFIFDEPTTGLHFHDIAKLRSAFDALIERGHTIVVIEHHLDVIKSADWLIEMGPEGGDAGGEVLYQGVPEGLLKVKGSHTAKYLKGKLK